MQNKVFVYSNGCIPNRLGGKKIQELLRGSDFSLTNKISQADYIIFNSCGYSGEKVNESLDYIHSIKRMNKKAKLILTGCLDKIAPSIINYRDLYKVINFSDLSEFFSLKADLNDLYISNSIEDDIETAKNDVYNVITSKGCVGNCTYCAIRKARGSISSKPERKIIEDFENGIKRGFMKFILWGDDFGAYGVDINSSFFRLINSLIHSQPHNLNYKLFIHRLNPQWMINYFDELNKLLKSKRIKMIYSPVQSGSNKILRLMKRSYKVEDVVDRFKEIKQLYPSIILKTDIMVGFPNEIEKDFEKTLVMLADIQFDDLVVFKFSGIRNTPAYDMKEQISEEDKQSRWNTIWAKFPSLRYNIDLIDEKFWIIDKKECKRKGPIQPNYYIL